MDFATGAPRRGQSGARPLQKDRLKYMADKGDKRGAASYLFMLPLFIAGVVKMLIMGSSYALVARSKSTLYLSLQTALLRRAGLLQSNHVARTD